MKHNANHFILEAEDTDGSGTYTPVAYISSNDLPMNNSSLDVGYATDAPQQTIVAGGGLSWDMSGSGIASDEYSLQMLIKLVLNGGLPDADGNGTNSWRFRVNWSDSHGNPVETFDALMFLDTMSLGGGIADKLEFTIALKSSGTLVYSDDP